MIIFDGKHLSSDSDIEELIIFAHKMGLKDRWIHISHTGIPHYDIFGSKEMRILSNGAVPIESKEFVRSAIRTKLTKRQLFKGYYER